MVDQVAPTVHLLISQLMPWLSLSAPSSATSSTAPSASPSRPSTPTNLPSSSPTKNHPFGHDPSTPGFIPTMAKVPDDFPAHSFAKRWAHVNSNIPFGYSFDVAYHSFEFGPDYVIVPPNHNITIFFSDDRVLEAYDSNEDAIFKIRSYYPLRVDTSGKHFQRSSNYVEFGAGTFRLVPANHPDKVMMWSQPVSTP